MPKNVCKDAVFACINGNGTVSKKLIRFLLIAMIKLFPHTIKCFLYDRPFVMCLVFVCPAKRVFACQVK